MKTPVEKAYDRHDKWLEITKSFGGLKDTEVEDIVQELYILLIRNTKKGIDFSYGDDINYYYCFRILRGLYVDLIRKKMKYTLVELNGLEITQQDSCNYVEVYEIVDEQGISISELSRKTDISYYSLYNTFNKVKSKLKELL